MSIFDGNIAENANELINKGATAVTRGFDTASLKVRQADLSRQRESACAALGASLFEATREQTELRADREDLFAAIEAIDVQVAEVEEQLAAIEAAKAKEAEAAKAAKEGAGVCANCGEKLVEGALFCTNCGTKIPEPAEPEPEVELVCPSCGATLPSDALFCSNCGQKL